MAKTVKYMLDCPDKIGLIETISEQELYQIETLVSKKKGGKTAAEMAAELADMKFFDGKVIVSGRRRVRDGRAR